MEVAIVGILGVLAAAALVLLGSVAGALFGALGGWVVGWTPLGDWILHVLGAFGAKGFTMAELGALLGFAGGFLRASVSKKGD